MAPNSGNISPEFSFRTRRHDWDDLKKNSGRLLNVLIVGGGVVGAGLLREMSLRGIKDCYLIEKNDFASGTSGTSSKLIHAGVRYLELAWEKLKKGRFKEAWRNFIFVFQASNERRILSHIAPHLIKSKPIYLLIAESDKRSVFGVFLGMWLYYAMQLFQGQVFRPPKTVFRKSAMRWIAPGINHEKIKAIFSFWDSETDDARLVIENLQGAHEEGGHALNYVELVDYQQTEKGVSAGLKNLETEETIRVETKILINASGPFVDEVKKREKETGEQKRWVDRVAGSHLNIYPALTQESYYVTAGDNRLVFVLKRNEDGLVYSRVGTTERPLRPDESTDHPRATEEEIEYLKSLVSDFFPQAHIDSDTLISVDTGIRPLVSQENEEVFQKSREHQIIADQNVYHVIGVKLTDYRRVSQELVELIPWKKLGVPTSPYVAQSEFRPLRRHPSDHVYEDNITETIARTMALHWDDFVYRRRGLLPQLWAKQEPERLYQEFERMAQVMKWDRLRIEEERNRVRI